AKAFFGALGMELEGEATVGGGEVDRLLGLDGVRTALAMMRTADGHGRIELTEYLSLPAAGDGSTPVHALGGHRVMFAVDDVDAALDRLRPHGAELIGDVVRYETHQLAYVRGPAGSRSHWPRSSSRTVRGAGSNTAGVGCSRPAGWARVGRPVTTARRCELDPSRRAWVLSSTSPEDPATELDQARRPGWVRPTVRGRDESRPPSPSNPTIPRDEAAHRRSSRGVGAKQRSTRHRPSACFPW